MSDYEERFAMCEVYIDQARNDGRCKVAGRDAEIQRLRAELEATKGGLTAREAELEALKAAQQWQPMHDFPYDQPNKEFLVKDPMNGNRVRVLQGRFAKLCGTHCFWMPLPPTDSNPVEGE